MFRCLVMILAVASAAETDFTCYKCTFYELETDSAILSPILYVFNAASDDHCKLDSADDEHEVSRRLCPPASSGEIQKCLNVEGEITTDADFGITDVQFKYKTVTRDCVNVDPDDDDTADGCQDHLPSYGPVRGLLTSVLSSFSLGDVEFVGQACYSSRELSTYTGGAPGTHDQTQAVMIVTSLLLSVSLYFM